MIFQELIGYFSPPWIRRGGAKRRGGSIPAVALIILLKIIQEGWREAPGWFDPGGGSDYFAEDHSKWWREAPG
jgi:hypothetical protein